MTFIEGLLISYLDIIEYVIIIGKILKNRKHNKILGIFCTLIIPIIGNSLSHVIDHWCVFFINAILVIIIIIIKYKTSFLESLYVYFISTTILIILQILTLLIGNMGDTFKDGMIGHSITLIGVLLISIFSPINILMDYYKANNKAFKLIVINLFTLVVFILIYWHSYKTDVFINTIILVAFLAAVAFINIGMLNNGLKNLQYQKQLETYANYFPVIDELIDEIRSKQHDFDNYIQSMKMLANYNTSNDEIIKLMKNYLGEFEINSNLGDLIKLENKILAGFLYSKKKSAIENKIYFDISIKNYFIDTKLKDYELVELVGILIDNAIEAEIHEKIVKVTLKKEKDMNIIEVSNKYPYLDTQMLKKMFIKGYSTKSSHGRGYGLYNLSKLLKKYDGKCDIENVQINYENYVKFKVSVK